jgi:hypothetical protein
VAIVRGKNERAHDLLHFLEGVPAVHVPDLQSADLAATGQEESAVGSERQVAGVPLGHERAQALTAHEIVEIDDTVDCPDCGQRTGGRHRQAVRNPVLVERDPDAASYSRQGDLRTLGQQQRNAHALERVDALSVHRPKAGLRGTRLPRPLALAFHPRQRHAVAHPGRRPGLLRLLDHVLWLPGLDQGQHLPQGVLDLAAYGRDAGLVCVRGRERPGTESRCSSAGPDEEE